MSGRALETGRPGDYIPQIKPQTAKYERPDRIDLNAPVWATKRSSVGPYRRDFVGIRLPAAERRHSLTQRVSAGKDRGMQPSLRQGRYFPEATPSQSAIFARCTSKPVFGSREVSSKALNPSPEISVWR